MGREAVGIRDGWGDIHMRETVRNFDNMICPPKLGTLLIIGVDQVAVILGFPG